MADHAAASGVRPRPLSPHLQVYRWTPTMLTSITHRATGLAMALGMAGLAWWLMALASGPEAYDFFCLIAFSIPGLIVILGFIWSLCFHLLNGIRHLAWDIGYGFDPAGANRLSVAIIALSLFMAAGIFAYGLIVSGAV